MNILAEGSNQLARVGQNCQEGTITEIRDININFKKLKKGYGDRVVDLEMKSYESKEI